MLRLHFFSSSLLLCMLFILSACRQEPPVNSLSDVFANIGSKPEVFEIDASIDNVIKGEKGSAVFFPANTFQFDDGTAPSGKVKIELKEFYSTSDIITGNLHTMSYGFMLETRGMMNITASADGKQLQLKEEKPAIVFFPKKGDTTTMGLFYGETDSTGNLNWKPGEVTPVPISETGYFIDEETLQDTTLFDCEFFIGSYSWTDTSGNRLWRFKDDSEDIFSYFEKNFNPSPELSKALCIDGYYPMLDITIDYVSGKIKNVKQTQDEDILPQFEQELREFFMQAPAIVINPVYAYSSPFVLGIMGHNKFSMEKYKARFEGKYAAYREQAIQKIGNAELNYYIFSATKLGWINCDYFWMSEEERIDFAVNAPAGNEAKVLLSFTDIKSVMNGGRKNGQFVFEKIPAGTKAKVIAISYANEKPLLSVTETTINNKEPLTLTAFKEFSLRELEAELNKLN